MKEWAIVPNTGMPYILPASTLLVPANPTKYAARASLLDASAPWVRRAAKSTTVLPLAACTTLEALVAKIVWRLIWLSRQVSTICPSIMGAVTSITGSPAKKIEPSFMARTLPLKRRLDSCSRKPSSNRSRLLR